jgi:hypothetical protein
MHLRMISVECFFYGEGKLTEVRLSTEFDNYRTLNYFKLRLLCRQKSSLSQNTKIKFRLFITAISLTEVQLLATGHRLTLLHRTFHPYLNHIPQTLTA